MPGYTINGLVYRDAGYKLVGSLEHVFLVGNVIIPTDELIFFRGVGQPPTSKPFFLRHFNSHETFLYPMNSHEPWRYHALPTSESQGTEWLMTCPNGSCGQFGSSPTSVGINVHGEEQANAGVVDGGW